MVNSILKCTNGLASFSDGIQALTDIPNMWPIGTLEESGPFIGLVHDRIVQGKFGNPVKKRMFSLSGN